MEHHRLTKEIERQFGLARTSPPHVTLKRPFESGSIEMIEDLLENFVKTHRKAQFSFKGFGAFENDVIYADVKISPEASRLIAEFDETIQNMPGLGLDKFEKNRKLHATLSDKGNMKLIFRQVWDFATLGSFDFKDWLDNIAILRKEKGKWQIYKKFELK